MKPLLILNKGHLEIHPSINNPLPRGLCILNKETQPRFNLFRGELIESYIRCELARRELLNKTGYQVTSITIFCNN